MTRTPLAETPLSDTPLAPHRGCGTAKVALERDRGSDRGSGLRRTTGARRAGGAPRDPRGLVSDADLEAGYRQARALAREWSKRNDLDRDAAVTEAVAGLAEAAERWRPERGATFVTFAHRCVSSRLGKLARRPDMLRQALDLDAPTGSDEGDGDALRDQVKGEGPGPEALLLLGEEENLAVAALHEELRAAVMLLPEFERKIVIRRYWIGDTQKAVALLLRVPQARIFRAEHAALDALRELLQPAGEAAGRC